MNKTQIIGAIMLSTGKTVEDLAIKHGYSKVTFYDAIKGNRPSSPAREIISKVTGRAISELWPEKEGE